MSLALSLLLCLLTGPSLVATDETPCTGDALIAGGDCSNKEEAGSFLQMATSAKRGSADAASTYDEGAKKRRRRKRRKNKNNNILAAGGAKPLSPALAPKPLIPKVTPTAPPVSDIQPIDCMTNGKPIQVLKDGKKGFYFAQLDVTTGIYSKVFDVPFSVTTPPYDDLNSCGINPIDGIAYCTMWAKDQYIVRVDNTTVEFVAKIPGTGLKGCYNTGTFSMDGVYYVANSKAKFFVIKDVHKIKGVANKGDKGLTDMTDRKTIAPKGFHSAGDCVVVKGKYEGDEVGEQEYLLVLNQGSLMIARHEDGAFPKTWIMSYAVGDKPGKKTEKWGAGWLFSGKVFFAINDGRGVYEINLFNLKKAMASKSATPFKVKRVGSSSKSGFNDGANCMASPDPWITTVLPFNCRLHSTPIQALRQEGPWTDWTHGYAIKKLDMATGTYESIYDLPFTMTTPSYKYLNAIGINPIDGIPYGCLLFDTFPNTFYIVRFDQTKFEYVAKMEGAYDPVAGTFNSRGYYFFAHNTNGSYNPVLFRYPASGTKLDSHKGYLNHTAPTLKKITDLAGVILWKTHHFADIVAATYNLDGTKDKEYIVAINLEQQAVLVNWNAENPAASTIHRFSTNDAFSPHMGYMNFGAAWGYNGRMFFSSNDGYGVFEVNKLDNLHKKLTLRKVGEATKVKNNDGFNCWKVNAPYAGSPPRITGVTKFAK